MAKKKISEVGSPIGYGACAVTGMEKPTSRDNNPDGPSRLPDHNLGGYTYNTDRTGTKKICFPDDLGQGESSDGYDVNVQTANGISNAKNTGRGVQYNWGPGPDGIWNKNDDFEGGNISGL